MAIEVYFPKVPSKGNQTINLSVESVAETCHRNLDGRSFGSDSPGFYLDRLNGPRQDLPGLRRRTFVVAKA